LQRGATRRKQLQRSAPCCNAASRSPARGAEPRRGGGHSVLGLRRRHHRRVGRQRRRSPQSCAGAPLVCVCARARVCVCVCVCIAGAPLVLAVLPCQLCPPSRLRLASPVRSAA
jgi:hypothetical protein